MRTVITYGRMNPPTRGHEMLVNKVQELAGDDDHHVFTSQTHDKKRNPLDPRQKHGYLQSSFPGANIQAQPSPFHALSHLQDEGYKDVTVVVGADRVSEFERMGSHRDFNFDNFQVVSAGERSGGDIENISASGARAAALDKRYSDFKTMTPTELSGKDVRRMYGDIRTQMEEFNLTEDLFTDKEELELFFEAYQDMSTLFEQDTYGSEEMQKDSATADANPQEKDKKKKGVERSESRKRFESNPWPELVVVRTANDGKMRIIPKADFSPATQEILLGNYPDMEPKGEVTPQAALSIMQENDFEPSKTSNKLLKMLGINDPAELKKGKVTGAGHSMGAGSGDAGAFGPQDMSAVMASRNPEDGIEITDQKSMFPDWDHDTPSLIDASVLIWNMNTGREPFANGVPVGIGDALGFSETLEPSAQRFTQGIMAEIPPNFESIDNTRNFGELTPTWVEGGGSDPTPKSDLIFKDPKSTDMIKTNVLVGKDQIFSPNPGEANALMNTLVAIGATDRFTAKKVNSKVVDNLRKDIGNVFSKIEQKSKTITEGKDDVIAYANEVYEEIIGTLEDIMSSDDDLRKSLIRETLTGELKFGTDSESSATHILATNKDGTDTQLQPITGGLISKINEVADVYVSLSHPDVEERLETDVTDGRSFIDYIRVMVNSINEALTPNKLTILENDYSPGTNFGIDFGDDVGINLDAETNSNQFSPDNFETVQQKQFIQAEINRVIGSLTNVFDIMTFFNINIESISMEPLNFTSLNKIKTDLYNVVSVNGKRFRIPVDQSITEMVEDHNYITDAFNYFLGDINTINEGRKKRKYKKGKGKCGTGSDPEWCYQKKRKKYRAKLQKYNRENKTHGNGDKLDASHKNGKISGYEKQGANRSRNGKGSKKRVKVKEEYGAGEQGTFELLLKYLRDTPGANVVGYDKLKTIFKNNKDFV
jgi:hypothetical protein